jgi:hypothetical protein
MLITEFDLNQCIVMQIFDPAMISATTNSYYVDDFLGRNTDTRSTKTMSEPPT